MGVGWVAGLNENITNSAKLGLSWAEFGNKSLIRIKFHQQANLGTVL